jgi:hypothetical protein
MNSMDSLELYQRMISKAVECVKLYHKVIFYTDKETLPYLNLHDVDIKIIDTDDFYFVDDFKVYLLDIIKDDEVIIDTDLFLLSPLYLEDGYDLYVDFKDSSDKNWYIEYLDWLTSNGIKELIPNFNDKIIQVPNIGILKFKNKELQKKYIETYYTIREWVLLKDKNIDRGISIILGQYLLALLIFDYKVKYCHKNKNRYIHLAGPQKFEKNVIDNIMSNKLIKII